ncbi:MAG: carboxysome shell carbonic anhydrase [Acetobacteraceae bacterium]|nr:carboxysome shell carbonic anhydrase [Acetobacteraceae bacterium]
MLADNAVSAALRRRAEEIDAAFAAIEPVLRALAPLQFEPGFPELAARRVSSELRLEMPESAFAARWNAPLDLSTLHARCVVGTFCRLIERAFDRGLAELSEGESAEALIRRWGFHALDITPCADGRLSGVIDNILRIPPTVVAYRQSYAGANFDVSDSVRHWESVELGRCRAAHPNPADEPTRFMKIGVYHFSSADPAHEGCAAHGSDEKRAAGSLLKRLEQFEAAVRKLHGAGAGVATLLIGVDTDTDAIHVHVPDGAGRMEVGRALCSRVLYDETAGMAREEAKEAIRTAVAAMAGVAADDPTTEGMRWFCGYVLKNNFGQVEAVRRHHGGRYPEAGHGEKLIVVGDAVDDVQLRNLAYQAQMRTVEEGDADLDVGVKVLRHHLAPRGLKLPVLVHCRYDERVPGSAAAAAVQARRLQSAIARRYPEGDLYIAAVLRAGDGSALTPIETLECDA